MHDEIDEINIHNATETMIQAVNKLKHKPDYLG